VVVVVVVVAGGAAMTVRMHHFLDAFSARARDFLHSIASAVSCRAGFGRKGRI
jgi:hypothetical protein